MDGLSCNPFTFEQILCCACDGTGRIRKFWLLKRHCGVCDGKGERPILVPKGDPEVAAQVRLSALTGVLFPIYPQSHMDTSDRPAIDAESLIPDFADPDLYQVAAKSEEQSLLLAVEAICRWEDGISDPRELAVCLLRIFQSGLLNIRRN